MYWEKEKEKEREQEKEREREEEEKEEEEEEEEGQRERTEREEQREREREDRERGHRERNRDRERGTEREDRERGTEREREEQREREEETERKRKRKEKRERKGCFWKRPTFLPRKKRLQLWTLRTNLLKWTGPSHGAVPWKCVEKPFFNKGLISGLFLLGKGWDVELCNCSCKRFFSFFAWLQHQFWKKCCNCEPWEQTY